MGEGGVAVALEAMEGECGSQGSTIQNTIQCKIQYKYVLYTIHEGRILYYL
jgi:hypothetical protein